MIYRRETWTISIEERKRIQVYEMWCYGKMLKMNRVQKITSRETLNKTSESRLLRKSLIRR